MTKKELADRLIESNKGKPVMTVTDLMAIFQLGHEKAVNIVCDLIPISKGTGKSSRAKYYFVDDIAEAIMRKGL